MAEVIDELFGDVASLRVNAVPEKFDAIPKKVKCCSFKFLGSTKKYLGARNDDVIPHPDYTSRDENKTLKEHFQGIQRSGRYLILSGGVVTGRQFSQLILIKMGTCPEMGPWALPKYGHSFKNPPAEDSVIKVVNIDKDRWHSGGIQLAGSILGLPIYGASPGSEIRFFRFDKVNEDLTEMTQIRLNRPHSKSKAVAMIRLPDGHHMTMVWDDNNLEFHYSNSSDITDGFVPTPVTLTKNELGGFFTPDIPPIYGTYQNVNFIGDTNDNIYFVATRNSQKASPTITGEDFADLYRIEWPQGYTEKPKVNLVRHKKLFCYNQQCNFGAGTGMYVDDPEHMYLYGASHWLHGGNSRFNFNEYSYT